MFWNKKPIIKKVEEPDDFEKTIERNKKADNQINRINIETQLAKETGDDSNLIKVYEDILLKEGICFVGNSHIIKLAELYYKNNQMDKAWGYLNKLGDGSKHADMMDKIRDVQVKILKKEEKYTDALIFQMAALFYQNSNGIKPTDKKVESKLRGLVKKCNLEDKYETIISLVFNSRHEIDMRNNFKEMLKAE